MRIADNAEERIQKRVDDQKFLDTTPNHDINQMWQKQCRKRNAELEIGPAFRYKHRNTLERLDDKQKQNPVSSEVIVIDRNQGRSPHRSFANGMIRTETGSPRGRASHLRSPAQSPPRQGVSPRDELNDTSKSSASITPKKKRMKEETSNNIYILNNN